MQGWTETCHWFRLYSLQTCCNCRFATAVLVFNLIVVCTMSCADPAVFVCRLSSNTEMSTRRNMHELQKTFKKIRYKICRGNLVILQQINSRSGHSTVSATLHNIQMDNFRIMCGWKLSTNIEAVNWLLQYPDSYPADLNASTKQLW